MVDFFLLIQVAGTGDELQGIKRGIMEISDGIVINKCDGDNVDRCQMAATNFRNALHFFPMPESGWTPKVLCYSGFYGTGVKFREGQWLFRLSAQRTIEILDV